MTGFSQNMDVYFEESVDVYDYDTSRVEIVSNGFFEFTNPSNNSDIYEYGFDFRSDVIFNIQLSSYSIDVLSNRLIGREILAGEKLKVFYILRGTIPSTSFLEFNDSGLTLMEWYSKDLYFSPMRHASLNKLDRDFSNVTSVSSRDIWIIGFNPSEFNVEIDYLNLYKTDYNDYLDFRATDSLLDEFSLKFILPKADFHFMGNDNMSDDTSVYWLEYSIVTLNDILSKVTINLIDREDIDTDSSRGSLGGGGNYFKDLKPLIISKAISDWIVSVDDVVEILVTITNVNSKSISNLVLEDYFPDVFKLTSIPEAIDFDKVIGDIKPYETYQLKYNLNLTEEFLEEIFYFKPAKLSYLDDDVVYSNSLSIINDLDYIGKKLFVEKVITYQDDGRITVKIRVKNIGSINLTNVKIIDGGVFNISDTRVWTIKKLGVDVEWEVIYDVEESDDLLYVPEVFGVIDTKIYKTIIVNSDIKTSGVTSSISQISYVLGVFVIVLLLVDILY